MKHFVIAFLWCCSFTTGSVAQQQSFRLQSISFSLLNENVSFPAAMLFENPIHPGASLGAVFPFAGNKNSSFGIHPAVGFYLHREHENGILLSSPVEYHYRFNFGLAIGGGIGIGYLHTISNQQEFKLDNGTYKKLISLGQPQFVVNTGIDLSYKFFKSRQHPMDVFAGYSFLVQLPYAAPVGIPLLPHTIFQIGTSWYFSP
ncbi:MAG: hypothetical protein ABIO46_05890 [Chitinophagales bacterium]